MLTNASGYNDIITLIYMYHYTCYNIMIGPTVNCRRRVFQLTNRICGNYIIQPWVWETEIERENDIRDHCKGLTLHRRESETRYEWEASRRRILYIYVCRRPGKISLMNVWCKLEERVLESSVRSYVYKLLGKT